MGFKIGDRVVVDSKFFHNQNGLTAKIIEFTGVSNGSILPIRVRYEDTKANRDHPWGSAPLRTNSYAESDLRLLEGVRLMEVEMELEEILQAEQVLQDLQKDG